MRCPVACAVALILALATLPVVGADDDCAAFSTEREAQRYVQSGGDSAKRNFLGTESLVTLVTLGILVGLEVFGLASWGGSGS